jgi:hypothetical protein
MSHWCLVQVVFSLEDLDINPCSYIHLIFDKGAQNIYWRKDSLFNNGAGKKWVTACGRLTLELCLSSCIINSRWVKDLNETLKLLQGRIGKTLEHIGRGSNFLNRIPIAQQLREGQQMGLHETKKLLHSKGKGHQTAKTVHRMVQNFCQIYI